MKTEDILDIVLVTYNRASYLEKTLTAILDLASPVRNCRIRVLNNNSTDGSPEIIENFCSKYSNVIHTANRFNIGGNANITRALEFYDKPYLWVICDDDKYDWQGWSDVENAMTRGEKLICVGDKHLAKNNPKRSAIPNCLQQMTFLPSIIFGPGTINATAIRNAYDSIFAFFPHLAPVIMHINNGGSIYVASFPIVSPGEYGNDASLTRGDNKNDVFSRSRTMFLAPGFANLTAELKDKDLAINAFKALVFGPQMGVICFYGEVFLHLRGKDGEANFHDIWRQSTLGMKVILWIIRRIQNSFLFHVINNRHIYNYARGITDRKNKQKIQKLHT